MPSASGRPESARLGRHERIDRLPDPDVPGNEFRCCQVPEARRRSSFIDSLENVRPQTLQRQGGAT